MSNRPPSRTGNRSVIYPGEIFTFPPPIGEARIKFDHDAMEWIEEALEPELDKLNARILDGRGPLDDHTGEPIEFPFDSVWDALGELSARRVARVTGVLVTGGLAHRHDGDVDARLAQARDEVGQMPFHLWNDEELHVAPLEAGGLGQPVATFGAAWPGLIAVLADATGRLSQGKRTRHGRLSDLQRVSRRATGPAHGREPIVVEGPWTGPS